MSFTKSVSGYGLIGANWLEMDGEVRKLEKALADKSICIILCVPGNTVILYL